MARKITSARDTLIEQAKVALLREFLYDTWKALKRKDRTRVNPRYIYGLGSAERFIQEHLANGVTVQDEVVLVEPEIIQNTRDTRRSEVHWRSDFILDAPRIYFSQEGGIESGEPGEIPSDQWVTSWKLTWHPLAEIAAMKPLPILLSRGRNRVREFRKAEQKRREKPKRRGATNQLTWRGKTQSAAAWAKELGVVSDRTITKRIKNGWQIEAALTTPSQIGGRPRKA